MPNILATVTHDPEQCKQHLPNQGSNFIEALICALAIHDGRIPPTINLEQPDPVCDLDYVPNVAREAQIDVALSNSIGLGGHNSALILRRYQEPL